MEKILKNSKKLEEFLNFSRQAITDYNYHSEALNLEDKRSQDLLHELELGPGKNKDKIATQLKKSRKERRIHKDFIEINESFYKFITSPEGRITIHQFEDILGQMRKQEKHQQNRIYIPRIKTENTN